MKVANIEYHFSRDSIINAELGAYRAIAKDWNETSRYKIKTEIEAKNLYLSIRHKARKCCTKFGCEEAENYLQDFVNKLLFKATGQNVLEDLKTIDLQNDKEWQTVRHLAWQQIEHLQQSGRNKLL